MVDGREAATFGAGGAIALDARQNMHVVDGVAGVVAELVQASCKRAAKILQLWNVKGFEDGAEFGGGFVFGQGKAELIADDAESVGCRIFSIEPEEVGEVDFDFPDEAGLLLVHLTELGVDICGFGNAPGDFEEFIEVLVGECQTGFVFAEDLDMELVPIEFGALAMNGLPGLEVEGFLFWAHETDGTDGTDRKRRARS